MELTENRSGFSSRKEIKDEDQGGTDWATVKTPECERAIADGEIERRAGELWDEAVAKTKGDFKLLRREIRKLESRFFTLGGAAERKKSQAVTQTGFEGYKAGDIYHLADCLSGRFAKFERELFLPQIKKQK